MKTFTLEDNEAEFFVKVIGQMPTQSGAFPLYAKLNMQFTEQSPAPSDSPQE